MMMAELQAKIQMLIADKDEQIISVPFIEAVGMKAGHFERLTPSDLIKLPPCSQMFMVPERVPVGVDIETDELIHLEFNPFSEQDELCYPVAAFLAPGYTSTYQPAYIEKKESCQLPLFAYSAVVVYKDEFYVTGTRVDHEQRQDPRYMDLQLMERNIKSFQKLFPENRMMFHLENCAVVNGCPAAKNFFLQRYEAPLPTSPKCNARCLGCISLQPDDDCPITQPRIQFTPTPEEIAEVALYHIEHVADPVVSFGQGCEGEPLLAHKTIEGAIKIIRQKTRKGIINLNTNASKPDIVAHLFDLGLDSLRVSINSLQEEFYNRYYNPIGYTFDDVIQSVHEAKARGGFVSLNYLTMSGFTDSYQEYAILKSFLEQFPIDMIQWRNLNYDPLKYFQQLQFTPQPEDFLGVDNVIKAVHKKFPHIMRGYFNPSRSRMRKHAKAIY